MISLLRHADRVQIACQAQLVNVIAPIRTEPGGPAWRQAIYDPFAETARHARGDVLLTHVDSPAHTTARYGEVPTLDAVATFDDHDEALTAILVNRSDRDPLTTQFELRGFPDLRVVERLQLCDDDPAATNNATAPDRVRAHAGAPLEGSATTFTLDLPPTSWTMVRFASTRSTA